MANVEQLEILKQGVDVWNRWRKINPDAKIDLRSADLRGMNLSGTDLVAADLNGANLKGVNLDGANLTGTDLTGTLMINAKVDKAKISESSIVAADFWGLVGQFEEQKDLIVTHKDHPTITVDNIYVAHHVYVILNQETTMYWHKEYAAHMLASKYVLILGRFCIPERKTILNALKNKLREYELLPIALDFDRPADKDFTETIKTLAGLCYFVIADVTNPKSSPLELHSTVPDYQIPIVPIIQEGENPFATLVDLQKKYTWVLKTVNYDSMETLIKLLKPLIIDTAMNKRQALGLIKAQEPEVLLRKAFLDKGKE